MEAGLDNASAAGPEGSPARRAADDPGPAPPVPEAQTSSEHGARRRDARAVSRDRAAARRDRRAETDERGALGSESSGASAIDALICGSRTDRESAAADRQEAARDRTRAANDRASAARDLDRARAELEHARLDGLTGVHRRDLGRIALQSEIDNARRYAQPFALAFIDVDGLKELNDREGHAAGDELLRTVGIALRGQLRADDPIVRVGGDEFVCGLTNTTLEASRRRVEEIRAVLERGPANASISVGLAVLGERDTLEKLIARADADMYAHKPTGRVRIAARTASTERRKPGPQSR